MPLTDDQEQLLIATQFGKTGDADFAALISLLWTKYDDLPAIDPRLRPLMVRREALVSLITGLDAPGKWEEAGVSEDNSLALANLRFQLELVDKQLLRIQGAGAAFVGQLTATAPIPPRGSFLDPNDRFYRGDPLRRGPWPWGQR